MNKKNIIVGAIIVLLIITVIVETIMLFNRKTVLTVSYEVNGEVVKTENVEEGKTATRPIDPTKEGYDFLGWFLGSEKFDFSTAIEGNIKLEAKWVSKTDENNKIYTITLNIDGRTQELKTDNEGLLGKIDAPTKSGYKFLGWYVDGKKVDLTKPFEKDTTIVAKWEKVNSDKDKDNTTSSTKTEGTTKYTVTFDSNGGSKVSKQTLEAGKTATKPSNPTRSGYTFKGWYLNGSAYNFSNKVTKNITLTAKWEKNKVVSYVMEELEGSVAGQVKIYVTSDGTKVAGTVDITAVSGTTKTINVPATGLNWNGKTIKSISNPRVK